MPLQARAGQEWRVRLRRGKVGQAPRGRRKPGTAARPDTALWNGAGFWQSGGCRRVTTATPEWLGWVERPMEAATRDAASVCFASAGRAGGADRIQRNRRADAVACWWRIGSTGRSRIAHMESRYQSEKQKAVGGHVRQRASIHRRRRRGPLRSPATCSSRMACDCSSRQIPMRQRAPVCVESSVSSGRDRSATVAPSLAPDGHLRSSVSREWRTASGRIQGYSSHTSTLLVISLSQSQFVLWVGWRSDELRPLGGRRSCHPSIPCASCFY